MKKYEFTLERMRSFKRQMLDKEKNALMSLQGERNRAEDRISGLEQQMLQVQADFQEKMQKGTSVSSIRLYEMQKQNIFLEQRQVRTQLMMLEANIERQRRVVVRVSQEVSGLDKLEEHQLEEYNKLLLKDNETVIEEFLSFRMLQERTE